MRGSSRVALLALFVVATLLALPNVRAGVARAAACGTTTPAVSTVYLPNITKTLGGPAGWVTPFYVQNTGTVQTAVEVTFYRFSDGAQVVCRRTTGLAPGTSLVDNPNADADLPGDTQFSVIVKSFESPVVAVVNQLQGSGAAQQALSYSGFASGATTVYVPNVTRRFFGWDVPLIVQNLGTVATSATATFTSAASPSCTTPHTYARTVAIDPGKSKVFDPDFEAAFTGSAGSGLLDGCQYSVVVTSAQPVALVVNAHNEVGGASAYSHNGIATGGTTLYAPYALRTTTLFSNVVVQNLGTAPVSATLTFTPLGPGTPQVFTLAAIPARGAKPFDVRYTNGDTALAFCATAAVTGCLSAGEYALTITATSPVAAVVLPVSATTAAGYLATSTPTQRALVPAAFRAVGGATGWNTTLFVQSATATGATLRWYDLATGDLKTTQTLALVPGLTARVDPRTVTGLTDNSQYSVTIDGTGTLSAIAFEQAQTGGDASMIFEAVALPAQAATGQAGSIRVSPASASVATGATQQLSAAVFDQFGVAMTAAARIWTVTPAALGTISPAGLFAAGTAAGSGTVTVTSGLVSASAAITVIAPTTTTVGGISFLLQSSATSDVYVQDSIAPSDRSTIQTQAAADVAQIQLDFGRTFAERPRIYVFATTTSYTQGLQTIFGLSAASAANVGAGSTGVWVQNSTAHAVGIDWQKQRMTLPATALRHELAHWMQHQIVGANAIPAWFDEGNARHAEYTIPQGEYKRMQNRYGAASMAATGTLLTLADMTDPNTWNARPGRAGIFQYYAASEAVQLLRTDLGQPKIVQILDRLGQGQTFETAYAAVSGGQSFATFSSTYATRVRAIAPVYPGIATAPDSTIGPGLSVQLYGFTPGSTVTVSVSSSLPFTQVIDEFGTYAFYLGTSFPAGSYTITATSNTGQTATTVGVKVSSVFDASVLDTGETGPRIIEELPLPSRD